MYTYKAPKTKEEYWNVVNDRWCDLYYILTLHLPLNSKEWIDKTPLDKSLSDYILDLKANRSARIARVFSAAHFNALDDADSWSIPGWNVLYDLCLTEKILYEN